jgi:hypothetical protein
MGGAERNRTIDFWRGFVLVTIFVNHIPGNVLERFTHRNYGFSDAAEAFVFISGLAVAMVYGRAGGVALGRCIKRAFHLYRVHVVLTLGAMGVFAVVAALTGIHDLTEQAGRGSIIHDTARGLTGVLLLTHQLGYFDILPLYVVLMLWAPVAFALIRRHPAWALAASVGIYVVARVFELNLPSWPEPGAWYFNPFAWQLLFTLGMLAGSVGQQGGVRYSRPLIVASVAVVGVSLVVSTDAALLWPGLWESVRHGLDVDKSNLGLVRLAHFLALAYLLSQIRLGAALARTAPGEELQRLGRHALPVFAVGSLFSAFGEVTMTLAEVTSVTSPALAGMVFTLLGAILLFLLARYLEWAKAKSGRKLAVLLRLRSASSFLLPRS